MKFLSLINIFVQQGDTELIKSDRKDVYVTKDLYFK